MLALGQQLAPDWQSTYVSFAERGKCRPFLAKARALGFEAIELKENFPRCRAAVRELTGLLRELNPHVLCCHNYKPNLLGWFAARRTGTPIVAVVRGWTGSTLRVRFYDNVDRLALHGMDAVVCVSEGLAVRARRACLPPSRLSVIRNAIDTSRFNNPDPAYRDRLQELFATPRQLIIGAAARLTADKGFAHLIEAAAAICPRYQDVGFVICGDGPLRNQLAAQIKASGLEGCVVLAGFRNDLDQLMPMFDIFVLPSFAEGLPNVVMEAFAAGVPVVATAVDGTPEVVDEGVSGFLVPPRNAEVLADRIGRLLDNGRRREMGQRGRERVHREFTFAAQAAKYRRLFERLATTQKRRRRRSRITATTVLDGERGAC